MWEGQTAPGNQNVLMMMITYDKIMLGLIYKKILKSVLIYWWYCMWIWIFYKVCRYVYIYIYREREIDIWNFKKCKQKSLQEKMPDTTIAEQVYNWEKYQIINKRCQLL